MSGLPVTPQKSHQRFGDDTDFMFWSQMPVELSHCHHNLTERLTTLFNALPVLYNRTHTQLMGEIKLQSSSNNLTIIIVSKKLHVNGNKLFNSFP